MYLKPIGGGFNFTRNLSSFSISETFQEEKMKK